MSDYDIVIKLDPGQPVAGAKQVTAAVAQVEVVGEKAKKAVDGVAEAAKSLKSIDFKQAAAAGAQAWGILSQKFELGNTLIGKAIDSTVKFSALGAQLGGPWGAALGGIAGLLIEVTDDVTGLRSEVTKLAEESKKLAEESIAKMGGRLGELAREAKKTAEALQKMNDGLYALPGAMANVFDALNKERDIVKRAREEIEKYNAAKFAASPQGNLAKGLVGGVFGREAKKPAASGGSKEWFNDAELNALTATLEKQLELEIAAAQALEDYAAGWRSIAEANPKEVGDDINRIFEEGKRHLEDTAEAFKKVGEEQKKLSDEQALFADQIKSMGTSLADPIVEAAHGADVAWGDFFSNLLKNLEKALAQALILKALTGSVTGAAGADGNYGGIIGALFGGAHATGGSYTAPATGGGPDSIPVMFRMSPRETATFTPHGQAFGGSAGAAASGATVNVVNTPVDDRALLQALNSPAGSQTLMNTVRQNRRAIKALLDG